MLLLVTDVLGLLSKVRVRKLTQDERLRFIGEGSLLVSRTKKLQHCSR